MPARPKTPKPTAENLIEAYMQTALETSTFPVSVYSFCKERGWEEADFYTQFGSLEGLRKAVWTAFFDQALERLEQSEGFEAAPAREKVLGFFYTFFELLGLNRSYVLLDLQAGTRGFKQVERLSALRGRTREVSGAWFGNAAPPAMKKLAPARERLFAEGFWAQLLFLLDFWVNDESAGFEKTDAAIEKSVNTIFDLLDHTPLERVIDFGKFLVRERFS